MEKKFDIEEFVKNNQGLFDEAEPPEGHFDRFNAKLKQGSGKGKSILYKSMRYAAVIIVLISAFLIYDQTDIIKTNEVIVESTDADDDFSEASGFYDNQINQKFAELNTITCVQGEGQKQVVNEDLEELTESFEDLENELKDNPNNPMIRSAMINNYQMRIEILDMVINTLKNYC